MHTLLELVSDKIKSISSYDEQIAQDYIKYYGIEKTELKEWADSFIAECYHLIDKESQLCEADAELYEANDCDNLPFAEVTCNDKTVTYKYRGQQVTVYKLNLGWN